MTSDSPSLNVVVFGGTSAIAQAILRAAAGEHSLRVLLISRNARRLQCVKDDLTVRGISAQSLCADPSDLAADWDAVLRAAIPPTIDLFIVAHGELPDQDTVLNDAGRLARSLQVNFVSPALIAASCIRVLERQGHGTLAVLGSVAADRGRASNFVYGSAKAGLETFLEGWRHRLAPTPSIRLVTIKPGLTHTPMTANMPDGPLFSSADKVGALSWKAIRKGVPVVYVPGWWRLVMALICMAPRNFLYRTKL